jgi:hypothetical protein
MFGLVFPLLAATSFGFDAQPRADLHNGLSEVVWIDVGTQATSEVLPLVSVSSPDGAVSLSTSDQSEVLAVVTPRIDVENFSLVLTVAGEEQIFSFPVTQIPHVSFDAPKTLSAKVTDKTVTFLVTGQDVPPINGLSVTLSGGKVLEIKAQEEGLSVTLEIDESSTPRVVPVMLLDHRRVARPARLDLILSAERLVPIETEAGAIVSLSINGRSYGPVNVGKSGDVSIPVDVFPGEAVVRVNVQDDLGNSTYGTIPLPRSIDGALVAIAEQMARPGLSLHRVYVRGVASSGAPTKGELRCWSAGVGEVPTYPTGEGEWMLAMDNALALASTLIRCESENGTLNQRTSVASGIPVGLKLQVWPDVMPEELPLSELRLVAEDAHGDRLPTFGVNIVADHGVVSLDTGADIGEVARGSYVGSDAVERGGDTVTATLAVTPSSSPVASISLGCTKTDKGVDVWAYAADYGGRPVQMAPLVVQMNGILEPGTTDTSGLVHHLRTDISAQAFFRVSASSGFKTVSRLMSGSQCLMTPGNPFQYKVSKVLKFSKRQGVFMGVDPPVLENGRNAKATVEIKLQDGAGRPMHEAVVLTASSGSLSDLVTRQPGVFVAEFTPAVSHSTENVTITARTQSGQSYSTNVVVFPRPVNKGLSLSAGGLTNFGSIRAPVVSVDFDRRTAMAGGRLLARVGLGTHWASTVVSTGATDSVDISLSVFSTTLGLYWRSDWGPRSLAVGALGVVAGVQERASFGPGEPNLSGFRFLPPGMGAVVAAGHRFGQGEVFIETRAIGLYSQAGLVSFEGQVSGLALLSGYRVVY